MMKLSQRQFEFTSINRIDLFKLALGSYNYFKSLLNPTTIFLNKFNLNKIYKLHPGMGMNSHPKVIIIIIIMMMMN